jgi:hypothetical protein
MKPPLNQNPDELAEEIVENLEAGIESFKAITVSLNKKIKLWL